MSDLGPTRACPVLANKEPPNTGLLSGQHSLANTAQARVGSKVVLGGISPIKLWLIRRWVSWPNTTLGVLAAGCHGPTRL